MLSGSRKANVELNKKELEEKRVFLESSPVYVNIGTANLECNAKCKFCSGGHPKRFDSLFSLDLYKRFFENKIGNVIERSLQVSFCGFGEVLLMRDAPEFLDYINKRIPEVIKHFTTNGTPLLDEKILQRFAAGNYRLKISLHASNALLHERITGLKGYDEIIKNIRKLIALRASQASGSIQITLVNILNKYNVVDLRDFLRVASELNVDSVNCAYMKIFKPEQIDMSCFFEKEKTNEILSSARETARDLGIKAILPSTFGNGAEEEGRHSCTRLWDTVYVSGRKTVQPCCNTGGSLGRLEDDVEFDSIWNNDLFRRMREGFSNGNLHEWCRNCMRSRTDNVNDILCHLSNDPGSRKSVISALGERGLMQEAKGILNNFEAL